MPPHRKAFTVMRNTSKTYMKLLMSWLVSISFLSCTEKNKMSKENIYPLETYNNSILNFSTAYPKGWDTSNLDKRVLFMAVENRVTEQDKFRENMVIYAVDDSTEMSLDLVAKNAEFALQQQYPDGKSIATGNGTNSHGHKFSFFKALVLHDNIQILSTDVYFRKNKKIFVLSLGNYNMDSARYTNLYNKIIDRFKISE